MAEVLRAERCCECEGELEIVSDDGTSLTVCCVICDSLYGLEKEIGPDGCVTLWPQFRIALKGE